MHKIKISIIKLFIFIIVLAAIPLATAHNLLGVYRVALFGAQNSNYSQFDNINLIIDGIIHFNDYIFLMIITLGFLVYFFGIKKFHKKRMHSSGSKLFFVIALVFITIYFILLMIPLISAQTTTVTAPNGGENITAGTSFSITWTESGNNHFKIGYSTDPSAACTGSSGETGEEPGWTLICHLSSCSSPKSVTLELNSSTVRVKVTGHNIGHTAISVDCSDNVFTIARIPSVPTNLAATTINASAINLSWDQQPSNELVTKYLIFRDGANVANTTDNDTQNYLDTGLSASTSYNYSIKANNPIGDSDFTDNVTATTTTSGEPPVVTLNLPVNSFNTNSNPVTFNCSATDDINLINITLYSNFTGSWVANETKNLTGISNSTTFSKTLNDGFYMWNCLAEDNDTNTDFGNSNFTLTVDNVAPSTVTNLSETSTGEFSIDWNWTNPSETDFNYTEIYRDGTFIVNVLSPTSNYTMEGLSASTTYTISTKTVDNAGNINTTFVNDSATTQASSNGGNGGGSDDISKTISGLEESRDHEGFCYTTDSGDTCPSSGTDLLTYCETYGWTVLWRHENHPESYSCTIGGSECIPNVTSTTMRVAVEAHNASHNFIGFACSSSFSVDSDNYGKTLTVTWPAPSPPSNGDGGGGGGGAGVTNETSEKVIVVEEIKKIIETIEPGEDKIISIEVGNIKEIIITAKNKISNAKIEVKQLENLPVDIKNLSNYVFSYFEINILNFSNDDIDNVSIIFRVNISLVDENNIDKDSITLNKFEQENWNPLQTSFVLEENGQYVYEALSDGFSLFAISGKEKLKLFLILKKIEKIIEIIPIPILIIIILIIIIILALFFKFKRENYITSYPATTVGGG